MCDHTGFSTVPVSNGPVFNGPISNGPASCLFAVLAVLGLNGLEFTMEEVGRGVTILSIACHYNCTVYRLTIKPRLHALQ